LLQPLIAKSEAAIANRIKAETIFGEPRSDRACIIEPRFAINAAFS
jgi:hypothetical protein